MYYLSIVISSNRVFAIAPYGGKRGSHLSEARIFRFRHGVFRIFRTAVLTSLMLMLPRFPSLDASREEAATNRV